MIACMYISINIQCLTEILKIIVTRGLYMQVLKEAIPLIEFQRSLLTLPKIDETYV